MVELTAFCGAKMSILRSSSYILWNAMISQTQYHEGIRDLRQPGIGSWYLSWLEGAQAHSQECTLEGATEAARVHFKKLMTFFPTCALPCSEVHIFEIFEAHRTQHFWLLIDRTVLLYWIKQAQQWTKPVFFREKIHSIDDWGAMAHLALSSWLWPRGSLPLPQYTSPAIKLFWSRASALCTYYLSPNYLTPVTE